jgi:hypothetical protein
MQIMRMYEVCEHFGTIPKDCKDLMKQNFPNLFVKTTETGKKGKNVSKMTSKSQHLIILFLVRLHYSVLVYNTASKTVSKPSKEFNFETFPQLETCLSELEGGSVASHGSPLVGKMEDASTIIENCQKKLKVARSNTTRLSVQLGEIDDLLTKILKMKKKKTETLISVVNKNQQKKWKRGRKQSERESSESNSDSDEDEEDHKKNEE